VRWGERFSEAPAAVRSQGRPAVSRLRRSHSHERGWAASWRPPEDARAASFNREADAPGAKGRGSVPFSANPAPGRLLCRRPSSPASERATVSTGTSLSRPAPVRQRGASLAAEATWANALPAGCQARGFPPTGRPCERAPGKPSKHGTPHRAHHSLKRAADKFSGRASRPLLQRRSSGFSAAPAAVSSRPGQDPRRLRGRSVVHSKPSAARFCR